MIIKFIIDLHFNIISYERYEHYY